MSDRLRGGTTIAGYTAYHKGNLLKSVLDDIGISYTSVTGTPTSLKNPHALTIDTGGLALSSGTTYDGSVALTISHKDTSSQASLTALTGVDVVSDIDLDTYGHVTSMSTRSLTYANLLTLFTPTAPTTLSLTETASGINVTFTPKDSAADRYEV
jgi:hypothetical protein